MTETLLEDEQATDLSPALVAVGVLLSGTSIAALLAEVYGIADMAVVGRVVTVPGLVLLAALGSGRLVSGPHGEELRRRLRVGAVAGVVGILGYDVFRIPFALAGRRLFAPIDSYGLLLSGDQLSSSVTDTVGWLFHLSNGVTFGTAYALVMARRHRAWGVLWGLMLESAVVLTPFRDRYHLTDWTAIGLAYAAHVPYGYAVGAMVQRLDRLDADLRGGVRRPALVIVGAAAVAIVLWLHPWNDTESRDLAHRLTEQRGRPVAVVDTDRFAPEWLRVDLGGCIEVENRGDQRFETSFGVVEPRATSELCFPEDGVIRVHLGSQPFSGGFVDVGG